MFDKKREIISDRAALVVSGIGDYSLTDTLECGQCFRAVRLTEDNTDGICEYLTVVGDRLVFVAQRKIGELIFFTEEEDIAPEIAEYFALNEDYDLIREDIVAHTDSEFLKSAARAASGIRILRQDPWEALFSFIISQNNNIPRIKKIIRSICAAYGENLAKNAALTSCPLKKCRSAEASDGLDECACRECGICYSFPTPRAVVNEPELLLPSHPGFRFKYLCDAARCVDSGEVDLKKIAEAKSYFYTLEQLQKIKGVGEKVASCTALFAFSNLEAFPIDVWMKRAIDEYFGGNLDPKTLGDYAGVAQQYIFHYIRTLSGAV